MANKWLENNREKWNAYMREYKRKNKIKPIEKDPLKFKARYTLANNVHRGKLKRGNCEICQKSDAHAHHEDYSKPLEVRWLCPRHHTDVHKGKITLITNR